MKRKERKGLFCKSRTAGQLRTYITRNDIPNCSNPIITVDITLKVRERSLKTISLNRCYQSCLETKTRFKGGLGIYLNVRPAH